MLLTSSSQVSLTLCHQYNQLAEIFVTADTVVLTHQSPGISSMSYADAPPIRQDILEKPSSKEDNLRMLLDMNGGVCEVVTGVSLGSSFLVVLNASPRAHMDGLVYPVLEAPGYNIKYDTSFLRNGVDRFISAYRSIDERTQVYFADNSKELLEAYADSEEGIDRAGGFAIQVGGLRPSKLTID